MTDSAARPPRGLARSKRWAIRLIYSRHALWGLGIPSFLESILVPIPLEGTDSGSL